jgi:D-glycero-D-manno-heptose 1,7-bisphosphate phosphatase
MILVRNKRQIFKSKYTYLACFDKDGTLVVDPGYVHTLKDFQWHNNGLELLKIASQQKAAIVVITNQSGISKKIFTKKQSVLFAKHLIKKAKEERISIKLVVICPHSEGINHMICNCRKPLPGMYLKVRSLSWAKGLKSIMIGNTDTDNKFAINSGIEYLDVNKIDSQKLLKELGDSLL